MSLSRMRQLEAFHAVMECGSVTRAAEILQVSQPAITKLIQALELDTGLRLFDRARRRLQPTREARRLVTEVERLFLTMNRIEHVANEIRSLGTGEMHVAAMPSVGLRFLPEILTAFRRQWPGVNVALTVTSSQNVVEMVQAGQVDLGIARVLSPPSALVVQPLASLPGVVVLPRDHPLAGRAVLAPEDLRDVPFVQLGREDRARHMIEALFLQRGVALQSMVQTHLAMSACEFVAAGAGVAVVEPVTASYYIDRLAVRPMAPAIYFEMSVVTALSRPGSAMIDSFVRVVRERLNKIARGFTA
jgi:DNA-binding transcriptional LysR family regulator